jgi:hypothetical protein
MQSQILGLLLALSMLVGSAAVAGVGTYLLTRRDLHGKGAALATTVCAILIGVSSWFAPFFAVFVFIGAAVAYLVMRRLVRVGPALAVAALILVGGLTVAELVMIAGLNSM